MKIIFIIILHIFFIAKLSSADIESANTEYSVLSDNGLYKAVLGPLSFFGNGGVGKVYSTADDRLIWTFDWYSPRSEIANDGRHMISFGRWASDKKNYSDLAIAFYYKNNLLKRYEVKDLVKDFSRIDHTVSHYTWEAVKSSLKIGFFDNGRFYRIVTVDKNVYEFEIITGEINKNFIDAEAKNYSDIISEEKYLHNETGVFIYNKTDSLKKFEKDFTISEIRAKSGRTYGIYFDEEEWEGKFTPKKIFPFQCVARLIFPIYKNDYVAVGINSEQLLNEIEKIANVPFIKELFNKYQNSLLRLRAAGDRLHWDSEEVNNCSKMLENIQQTSYDMKSWINFIIDLTEHKTINFLHPKDSNIFIITFITFNDIHFKDQVMKIKKLKNIDNLREILCYENFTIVDEYGNIQLYQIK